MQAPPVKLQGASDNVNHCTLPQTTGQAAGPSGQDIGVTGLGAARISFVAGQEGEHNSGGSNVLRRAAPRHAEVGTIGRRIHEEHVPVVLV